MQSSECLKLFLMFLLIVVICVTLKCQLKGGALYQDEYKLKRDLYKCTFNSLIHGFVANRDLNEYVCGVLQKRIKRGESRWKELHNILCNKEYHPQIISTN